MICTRTFLGKVGCCFVFTCVPDVLVDSAWATSKVKIEVPILSILYFKLVLRAMVL